MADYKITIARSARKELQALALDMAERVLQRIESLSANPRPSGCKKLSGSTDLWRIRISDYRVVYRVDDTNRIVDVTVVRHRREVYR
jgi:mRNA interferase RelE/StbE